VFILGAQVINGFGSDCGLDLVIHLLFFCGQVGEARLAWCALLPWIAGGVF